MDVRRRVENRDVSLDGLNAAGDPIEALFDRLLADVDLPAAERAHVREAFEALADGSFEAAAEVLRERYTSVCERRHPDGERAACHLHADDVRVDADGNGVWVGSDADS
jgi:peptide/nickel transport system ATP-binding protein